MTCLSRVKPHNTYLSRIKPHHWCNFSKPVRMNLEPNLRCDRFESLSRWILAGKEHAYINAFFCSPATRHGGTWGERSYSSYSFSTSALDGVSGQRHAPAALLPPGKGPPVPIVQEAGWAPQPVWTQRLEEKSFAPAGDRTPIARSSSP
jgi:hypothetical protein